MFKISNLIIVFLLILLFILALASKNYPTPTPQIAPISPTTLITQKLPSTIPAQGEVYKKSVNAIEKKESPIIVKEAAVGRLLDLLPYKGKFFLMKNDYNNAQYILIISKENEKEGNEEFDNFLKKNGVENRNWIRKNMLLIKYE